MDEKTQQAFIQFLAQKLGVQSEEELEAAIQQMGEEGLQQAYAEFMQMMQQQQVQAAKFGAKLNYIKSLRGICPDGYEAHYFKSGGSLVKKCTKCQHQQIMADGGKTDNPIKKFKEERNKKKGFPLKENGKTNYYKDQATRDSIAVNRYNDDVTSAMMPGNMKKNKKGKSVWTPDRTKAPYNK